MARNQKRDTQPKKGQSKKQLDPTEALRSLEKGPVTYRDPKTGIEFRAKDGPPRTSGRESNEELKARIESKNKEFGKYRDLSKEPLLGDSINKSKTNKLVLKEQGKRRPSYDLERRLKNLVGNLHFSTIELSSADPNKGIVLTIAMNDETLDIDLPPASVLERFFVVRENVAKKDTDNIEEGDGNRRVVAKERPEPMTLEEKEHLQPAFCDASSNEGLCEMLVAARKRVGLSQAAIAERMGTDRSNIARIENGRSTVSVSNLRRYAEAVGARLEMRLDPIA